MSDPKYAYGYPAQGYYSQGAPPVMAPPQYAAPPQRPQKNVEFLEGCLAALCCCCLVDEFAVSISSDAISAVQAPP